ncbi:DAP3-binding cell death enhancer 1 [Manis javanica]|nr:DAP3-binding cell death enhancer 1 [Manis javanica]
MWRLQGLLGRALPRLLGPGLRGVTPKSTSPDGPQATSSTLLVPVPSFDRSGPHGPGPGTSRGPRSHGWKDAFQWVSARVSPGTLWDAVSWGTLAVLALQLARQIHFQASLPAERGSWRSPLDHFLSSPSWHPCSSLRRHVLPNPDGPAAPRHTSRRELRLGQEEPSPQPEGLSHRSLRAAGLQDPPEEDPSDTGFLQASGSFKSKASPAQPQPPGEKQEQDQSKTLSLEEAVTLVQKIFQLSVSVAFNFLGTESVRNGDHVAAFSYFQKAAHRGYSKAQYNVGLCHEHGRGTPRDLSKAAFYYQLAANQGHSLAQYRYARCLLQDSASLWGPGQQRAVSMLKQAADSGLREAQAFLGVLFTKEPYLDEQRAVKYLWLAANSGDSQSRGGSPGAQRPGPSGTEVLLQPLPLQPELSADRDLAPPALLKHREPWPSLQRWAAWSQPRSPQQGCAPNLLPLGKECRQTGLWLRPPHCGPKDGACAFSEGYPNLNPKEEASYPLTTPKTLRTCPSPAKKRLQPSCHTSSTFLPPVQP